VRAEFLCDCALTARLTVRELFMLRGLIGLGRQAGSRLLRTADGRAVSMCTATVHSAASTGSRALSASARRIPQEKQHRGVSLPKTREGQGDFRGDISPCEEMSNVVPKVGVEEKEEKQEDDAFVGVVYRIDFPNGEQYVGSTASRTSGQPSDASKLLVRRRMDQHTYAAIKWAADGKKQTGNHRLHRCIEQGQTEFTAVEVERLGGGRKYETFKTFKTRLREREQLEINRVQNPKESLLNIINACRRDAKSIPLRSADEWREWRRAGSAPGPGPAPPPTS